MTSNVRRSRGFTLLELMIVVSIIGILASLAIPAFGDLVKDNRRTTVVNELVANLMVARAEAAKRGQSVTVCGMTSGGGTSCTGGANWDYGWMVFVDPDGDGAIAAMADVVRQYKNDYPDVRIRTATGGTGHITLQSFSGTRVATERRILVCDKRGDAKARRVCVSPAGRARASEQACDTDDAMTCP